MIGKNTLKNYEFESLEKYFNYIVESQINGNLIQVKELFKRLSNEQKKGFFDYLKQNEINFNYTGLY